MFYLISKTYYMVSEDKNIHRNKVKINIKGISQYCVITLCAKISSEKETRSSEKITNITQPSE